MKKSISIALLLCFLVSFSVLFVGCGNKPQNTQNTQATKFELNYIKNLQLNSINNIAGFSIKKDKIANAKSTSTQSTTQNKKIDTSFINFATPIKTSRANSSTSKNYIYSTSQKNATGNVEYDSNTVQKVTFKKNSSITENIYDDKGNIIDSKQTITQEEIPAQINKLYATKKFTFMQFVPLCDENSYINGNELRYDYYEDGKFKHEWVTLRPDSLTYNANGITDFDSAFYDGKGYYSSAASQSFIVDNKTGYIYKLENLIVKTITDDDLVIANNADNTSDGDTYKLSINELGELIFTDVMPNKDAFKYHNKTENHIITDKYGYTFVSNMVFDEIDVKNKIIYIKPNYYKKMYLCDENKNVYIASYDNSSATSKYTLHKVYVNGVPQNIDSNITCFGLYSLYTSTPWSCDGFYKGKVIKKSSYDEVLIEDSLSLSSDLSRYASWFDNETIIVLKNDTLYSYHINYEECYNKNKVLTLNDFTVVENTTGLKLSGGGSHQISVGNDKIVMNNVYYTYSLTGTKYYQLIRNGNNLQLKELEDKNYTQNIFIFQPINRE